MKYLTLTLILLATPGCWQHFVRQDDKPRESYAFSTKTEAAAWIATSPVWVPVVIVGGLLGGLRQGLATGAGGATSSYSYQDVGRAIQARQQQEQLDDIEFRQQQILEQQQFD